MIGNRQMLLSTAIGATAEYTRWGVATWTMLIASRLVAFGVRDTVNYEHSMCQNCLRASDEEREISSFSDVHIVDY
jgi:hypothetical protein